MANNDILSEFSSSDVNHFKKDFMQIIKVSAEIDRHYGEAKHDLNTFIPKFERLVLEFNRKYKGVKLRMKKGIDYFTARVFVNEKSIKELFANSASRIAGLKSVGISNFNQVGIGDAEKFAVFLDSLLDKVYVSYVDPESGTSTLTAIYDKRQRMVEIIFSPAEMLQENSASFRICAYYALKQGFNKKIEIYGDASTFGFSSLLNELEKREWFDRFNPRFLE